MKLTNQNENSTTGTLATGTGQMRNSQQDIHQLLSNQQYSKSTQNIIPRGGKLQAEEYKRLMMIKEPAVGSGNVPATFRVKKNPAGPLQSSSFGDV